MKKKIQLLNAQITRPFYGSQCAVSPWKSLAKLLATVVNLTVLCALLHAQTPPETLYVSQVSGASKVGKYDATTGAAINANFITTGLSNPFQLAVLGNNLFVVNQFNFGVDEYNATTGALIKANFVSGMQRSPYGIAVSGNNLFVVSGSTVGEYDATTGATINANFITGLSTPLGIAVSGNNLFVANQSGLNIGEYNA